jgi:SAM-dependent methyltransferase
VANPTAAPRPALRLPAEAVAAFDAFLAERFPKATPKRLLADAAELSDIFTAERAELPGSYLNQPPMRSAYLAFVHPQQVLRGLAAIQEVRVRAARRGLWPEGRPRVADLGAGLGAMSQALLLAGTRPAEITLVDHQKSALADARDLTKALAGDEPPHLRTAVARAGEWLDRARREGWRYDVVLLGGLLNEVRGEWEPVLERVLRVLDPAAPGGGIVVVVEPAIPPVARKLMELRDSAIDATTTIAPCTHGAACPMLALRKDWCFTVRAAELPPRAAAIARELRHQTGEVRFALWGLAGRPEAAPFEVDPRRHARVVSDRMAGEQVLCADGALHRIRPSSPLARGDLAVS